jgi:hypothetical protein
VNLSAGTVRVRNNWVELLESPDRYEKEPKSEAGKRDGHHTAALPEYRGCTYCRTDVPHFSVRLSRRFAGRVFGGVEGGQGSCFDVGDEFA